MGEAGLREGGREGGEVGMGGGWVEGGRQGRRNRGEDGGCCVDGSRDSNSDEHGREPGGERG